jgi:hypothetical protein
MAPSARGEQAVTNVYVVTDGEYSDYRIVAIFSKLTNAEALVEKLSLDQYNRPRVETWVMDSYDPHEVNCYLVHSRPHSIEVASCKLWQSWVTDATVEPSYDREIILTQVLAADVEHATKIAADRFREYVAINGWPKPRERA